MLVFYFCQNGSLSKIVMLISKITVGHMQFLLIEWEILIPKRWFLFTLIVAQTLVQFGKCIVIFKLEKEFSIINAEVKITIF